MVFRSKCRKFLFGRRMAYEFVLYPMKLKFNGYFSVGSLNSNALAALHNFFFFFCIKKYISFNEFNSCLEWVCFFNSFPELDDFTNNPTVSAAWVSLCMSAEKIKKIFYSILTCVVYLMLGLSFQKKRNENSIIRKSIKMLVGNLYSIFGCCCSFYFFFFCSSISFFVVFVFIFLPFSYYTFYNYLLCTSTTYFSSNIEALSVCFFSSLIHFAVDFIPSLQFSSFFFAWATIVLGNYIEIQRPWILSFLPSSFLFFFFLSWISLFPFV